MKLADLKQRYWHPRPIREKRMLLLAASIVLPVLGYLILWQPASEQRDKLLKRLPDLRQQAAQLQLDALEVQKLRHSRPPAQLDANTLISTIESTAERYAIREQITSINTQGPNTVQLNVNALAFSQWLDFLRELHQTQHIRVLNTSIAALPQTGFVKISAVFISGEEL